MFKSLEDFISNLMVEIPDGIELIRHFKDNKKWISSNYKMSTPSKGHKQVQTIEQFKIQAFLMLKYPVTNRLYNHIYGLNDTNDDLPKVNVSWIDAIEFTNAISIYFGLSPYYVLDKEDVRVIIDETSNGFRLPTNAEWQYACKGDSNAYQYGPIDDIAWHQDNANHSLHEVGLKRPNGWQLYDMLGNVWEWCYDLYNPDTYDNYRIFKGGSFASESRICGATTRRKSMPDFHIDDLGFRIVINR